VTVLARGWATVELDRAAAELAGALEPGTAFEPAPSCVHLGASCRIGRLAAPGDEDGQWLILLEPSTEGRLALTLARHGEGWCATWLDTDPDGSTPRSAARVGPLGPERLLLDGPPSGPHRLIVAAATIAS
jgi:hypothetical protein